MPIVSVLLSGQWADPRPLPEGWQMKFDDRTKRHYFVNHVLKSTQWEDRKSDLPLLLHARYEALGLRFRSAASAGDQEGGCGYRLWAPESRTPSGTSNSFP